MTDDSISPGDVFAYPETTPYFVVDSVAGGLIRVIWHYRNTQPQIFSYDLSGVRGLIRSGRLLRQEPLFL